MTAALKGANMPKLVKMTASQKTSTTKNGIGMELSACSSSSERVRPGSEAICSAWPWTERWKSLRGASS